MIQAVYAQLQETINRKIEPAPDDWDRKYDIDFYCKVRDKYIGIQIRLVGYSSKTQIIREGKLKNKYHKRFTERFGGKVFYVFFIEANNTKVIYNPEIIDEIRTEMDRL